MRPLETELLAREPELRRLALRLVRDDATADDLVQEAWVVALQRPAAEVRRPPGWLRTLTWNSARRHLRREGERRRRETVAARAERVEPAIERLDEGVVTELREVVGRLAEPYAEVIRLRFLEELSAEEIGSRLGRPPSTVRSQVKRGLDRLRADLDRRHGGERAPWCAALAGALSLPLGPAEVVGGVRDTSGLEGGRDPALAGVETGRPAGGSLGLGLPGAAVLLALAGLAVWLGPRAGPLFGPDASGTVVAGDATERESSEPTGDLPAPGRSPATAGEASAGGAPEPANAATAEPPAVLANRRLELLVVDPQGEPVAGARILVHAPDVRPERGRTDSAGRHLLEVAERDVTRLAWYDDRERVHVQALAPGRIASRKVSVPCEAGTVRAITIEVGGPALGLRGRLIDPAGDPIVGARVEVGGGEPEADVREGGVVVLDWRRPMTTDAEGRFELTNLAPGVHRLHGSAPGFVPFERRVESTDSPVHGCTIELAPAARLTGTVHDARGRPVAGAAVWMEPLQHVRPRPVVTGPDGTYVLDALEPGPQRVWAQVRARPELVARTALDVHGGADLVWNPVLDAVEGIGLRVVDEEGAPLEGWFTFFVVEGEERWCARHRTGSDGRVRVHDVPDGPVAAHVFPAAVAVQFPARTLTGLRPGPDEATVVVAATTAAETALVGRLVRHDGSPCERADLVVRDRASGILRGTAADPRTGAFAFRPVSAGRYELAADLGEEGVAYLGVRVVETSGELDLGSIRVPAPAALEIDWRHAEGARLRFTLSATVEFEAGIERFPVDRGAAPRRVYRVLPGRYELVVFRGDERVSEHALHVRDGATVRLALGP